MQQEMLAIMATTGTPADLAQVRDTVYQVYCKAARNLSHANPPALAISRRISRTTYAHRCIEGAAVQAYRDAGVEIAPGMKISYVVRDARTYRVDPEWAADRFDLPYYRGLLDKAWKEISYAFTWEGHDTCGEWKAQKDLLSPEFSGQSPEGVPDS
jgi:DNA polymerase elongation subunit (family B)